MLDFVDKWKHKVAHYIDVRLQLMKLSIIERASAILSYFIFAFISLFLLVTVLLLLGIGIGELMADLVNSRAGGYFITAGLYILLVVLLFAFRGALTNRFAGIFIAMLTQVDTDEEDTEDKKNNGDADGIS